MKFAISRREFLKITSAATLGLLVANNNAEAYEAIPQKVLYRDKEIPLLYEADVCVVGGGPSGVAAAYSAAQNGVSVVLVEKGIALGGQQTMGNVIPCMQTYAPNSDTPYVLEVKKRLLDSGIDYDDKVTDMVWTNPETMSRIYDEMCTEQGVEVLYNMVLTDVVMDYNYIEAIIVHTITGPAMIKAKTFIDSSGDAVLSRLAAVPVECGSEKTGRNQPMTFRFEMGGIDINRLYNHVSRRLKDNWCKSKPPYYEIAEAQHRDIHYVLEKFMLDGVKSGELTQAEAEYMQGFTIIGKEGCMSMNCPELPFEFKATDPISYSRGVRAGRQMIYHVANYFIKHMPGFEKAYIAKEASMLGVRESWRIRGKFYMTEKDYHDRSRFSDAVAQTAWFIDAHGEQVEDKLQRGEFYEIPYRAMITSEVPNLIVTGRCISASFVLQASMRIQLTCMSIGEAAGIAAAWGLRNGIVANEVQWDAIPEKKRSYVTVGA